MDFIKTHKKIALVTGAALVVILVGIVFAVLQGGKTETDTAPIVEDTGFQTILPSGKTIKDLGGWERISPLNTAPVFAYADKIDDVSISISQQPLPFTGNIDEQVGQLAAAYSATNTLDASGTKVYIGTSAKGPQSTIFSKKDLLVLIKSQAKINNESWTRYISSLQ